MKHLFYTINTQKRPGGWRAAALAGPRLVPGSIKEAKTEELAVAAVKQFIDELRLEQIASRANGVPTVEEYTDAFLALHFDQQIKPIQRAMLREHHRHVGRRMTMRELAQAAGSKRHETANTHYINLGHLLCDALAFEPPKAGAGEPIYTSVLAIHEDGEDTEPTWTMREEVAQSLEKTDIFAARS